MHQWMTDSGLTPHVMVDATASGVEVPVAHVREGRIVLNLSYDATRHLDIGDEWVSFEARFSGVPRPLRFPASAVQGIYASETGEGLMFPPGEDDSPLDPNPAGPVPDRGAPPTASKGGKRPTLKVVK
jgi:stringent starvation protein B